MNEICQPSPNTYVKWRAPLLGAEWFVRSRGIHAGTPVTRIGFSKHSLSNNFLLGPVRCLQLPILFEFQSAITAIIAMSDNDSSSDDGLEDLFDNARISEKGLAKLAANEVTDKKTILLFTTSDINALKLAVADKARLINLISSLKPKPAEPEPKPVPVIPETKASVKSADSIDSSGSLGVDVDAQVGVQVQLPGQSTGANQQFGIAEVAAFLAGRPVPPELNAALNALPALPSRPSAPPLNALGQVVVCPTQPDVPGLFPAVNTDPAQQAARYDRHLPYLPPCVPSAYQQSLPSQLPTYLPMLGNHSQIPTRMSTTQSLNRDLQLQQHYAGYQNSVLRDFSNINNIQRSNAGEGQLFLPVNFVSHIRGSGTRTDDEELMKTESGASLYLSTSNTPRKVVPEKLNRGLFFGANARILARLIPSLTPEIAIYLDYLRQIGDLFVNYTSQSVYCLDHEHRFEVVELGKAWNEINPMLALNVLKKKDVGHVSTSSSTAMSKSTSGSKPAKSDKSDSKSYGVLPICWQWNQPEGCKYPTCRYHHKCNVEGCGGPHPAWKHHFQTDAKAKSP
jgi:hypothetical protein